jgi:membrane fusion protein, multidrug efflux system
MSTIVRPTTSPASALHRSRSLIPSATLVLVLAACSRTESDGAATAQAPAADATAVSPIAVAVATAGSGGASSSVIATGTFGPRDEIPLSFKIGGVIAQVSVDQGTAVRKGQTLAVLDLREIDAMVNKARVGVDKAERDVARLRRLVVDSVATTSQLQDAESAAEAARADLTTARVNREFATIIAPEDGVVLQRQATPGTTIGAGTPVITLGGSRRGKVLRVGVPDRDVLRVRVGDVAQVRFDALPDRVFSGKVSLVGQSADSRTGTYTVEVQLADGASLPTGLVGRAEIAARATTTGAITSATLVPVDALVEADADSAIVYTVSETTPLRAQPHRVHILQLTGDQAAISGLDSGVRVITRGSAYVRPDALVRITTVTAALAKAGVP